MWRECSGEQLPPLPRGQTKRGRISEEALRFRLSKCFFRFKRGIFYGEVGDRSAQNWPRRHNPRPSIAEVASPLGRRASPTSARPFLFHSEPQKIYINSGQTLCRRRASPEQLRACAWARFNLLLRLSILHAYCPNFPPSTGSRHVHFCSLMPSFPIFLSSGMRKAICARAIMRKANAVEEE